MPPLWMDLWTQNSLNKGLFLEDFPYTWVGLAEIHTKLSNIGSFLSKFITKVDMKARFGNKRRVPL